VTIPPPYGENAPTPTVYGEYPPTPASYDTNRGAGYGDHPGYPGYPRARTTNSMAIASLISAFVFAPLGIVFGHISLSQLKRSREDGRGLAIAGLVIGYVVTTLMVIALIGVIVFTVVVVRYANEHRDGLPGQPGRTASSLPANPLPPFKPPATLGTNCQYPATTEPASKPVHPPKMGAVATSPATIAVSITTDLGPIGVELDNAKAPCTVNNFTSLVQQGFFNDTACHRLTTSPASRVLQCGDPTGTGTGGPGYRFPNEYPTNQYKITDPALEQSVVYPRGTLAMANTGPGTNGSQFFIVYKDSRLPPRYTVFGTVDSAGLAVVERIAAAGVQGGGLDGKPTLGVTIQSARLN
jgi:peptidyl-prolyl cis-trans isomerase B (cyclophilin B)